MRDYRAVAIGPVESAFKRRHSPCVSTQRRRSRSDGVAARECAGCFAVCLEASLPMVAANVRLFRKCHFMAPVHSCRVEGGDSNPHVASCARPCARQAVCHRVRIVRNAVRVAGMVAPFKFRGQCGDVSGTQVCRLALASKRVCCEGMSPHIK